jgi:hypothetical protein
MASIEAINSCNDSLKRVQAFDASALSREDDLGRQMSFADAVNPAESMIALYKRIPLSSLTDFSENQLSAIQNQANSDFNIFKQILDFNAAATDAVNTRSALLNQIKVRRDQLFEAVWQYVAYGVARAIDSSVLETQARSTIQSIEDQAEILTSQLSQAKIEAEKALSVIRDAAAEQGVSQKAFYFKEESETQEILAAKWLKYTYWFAFAIGFFAVFSLVLHKLPEIKPENTIEAIQLITSKILIFTVLGFLLVLASKNYATHKHNSVINKHRQNALLTFRSLVEASATEGTADIVLAHAAACIFSPQETGFSQARVEGSSSSKSVLELFTKSSTKSGE